MTDLYKAYLNQIRNITAIGSKNPPILEKGIPSYRGNLLVKEKLSQANKDISTLDSLVSMQEVAQLFGVTKPQKPKLEEHPDFVYLRSLENETEEYPIVSVFIDVKNSTSLFRKYPKEQVHLIIKAITTASTHTMALFGGHIQRIMFDGVFCYFGGKRISENEAITNAINATTVFCFFMKYELAAVFDSLGLEKVDARIGIDFGEGGDVLWGINGIDECSELSTTSLHTSLASKMQGFAPSNGIMVGENVRNKLNEIYMFCSLLRDSKGNVDESKRYIFRNPDYTQFSFNWVAYLRETKKQYIKESEEGKLIFYPTVNNRPLDSQTDRLKILNERTKLIDNNSNVFLNSEAKIVTNPTNIQVPKNSFYYDKH